MRKPQRRGNSAGIECLAALQVQELINFRPSLGKGCAGGVSGFLENVVSTRVQVSTPHSLVPKSKVRPSTQNLSLIYRESTRDSSEISKIRQIRPKLAVLAQFLPHRKTQEKSVAMAPDLSSTLKILRPAQKRPLGKFISRWTCTRYLLLIRPILRFF